MAHNIASQSKSPTGRAKAGRGYLVTDIDASVEKWERAGQAMQRAIVRHDEIIAHVINRYGGQIRDRAGDGFFAVFDEGDVLACALDIQRQLHRQDWTEIAGLSVRMAIHWGQAREASADQINANRAGRIAQAAWGGQILVSAAALNTYGAPAQAHCTDLGYCRFRGVSQPIRLYTLSDRALERRSFPPPRGLLSRPASLPAQAKRFFGRDAERAALVSRFEQGVRLITLTGPGGVGKTALAIALGEAIAQERAVYFASWEGLSTTEFALLALAQAAGLVPGRASGSGARDFSGELCAYFGERAVLLIIDNAETVEAGGAGLEAIVRACPHVQILVTSRAEMGVSGEHVVRLGGLVCPDDECAMDEAPAVRTFLAAARAHAGEYVLDARDYRAFRAICAGVGGSPLGLQLVAEWTRVLSLGEIAARLEDGVGFLMERADGPDGRGLLAAVQGSWDLLAPAEQRALAALSVLKGSFDAEAARAVGQASVSALMALERANLLERRGPGRFKLHPLVHAFAAHQCAALALKPSPQALAGEYYLAQLRRAFAAARGQDQGTELDAIERDFDNIAAAWRFALEAGLEEEIAPAAEALFYVCVFRARFEAGLELFEAPELLSKELKFYCSALKANCLVQIGAYERAAREIDKGVRALGAADPKCKASNSLRLAKAHIAQARGNIAHAQGAMDEAIAAYQSARALRAISGDGLGGYYAALALALALVKQRRLDEARVALRESFRLGQRAGHLGGMIVVHACAGEIAMCEQKLDGARWSFGEALRIADSNNYPQLRAPLMMELGALDLAQGDEAGALKHFNAALDAAHAVSDQRIAAAALAEAGKIHARQGATAPARAKLLQSLKIAVELGLPVQEPIIAALGQLSLASGDEAGARAAGRLLLARPSANPSPASAALIAMFDKGELSPFGPDEYQDALMELINELEFGALRL